jgi:hypothetical protein
VAGQHGVAQVEVFQQDLQVGGKGVVAIPRRWLAGLSEAAPVVGDDPVSGFQQDRNLLVPGAAAKRVAVDQHYGLAGAVVLVVHLDVGAVLSSDFDKWH